MTALESVFSATPPQSAFLASKARIRGYGGAMGGGKSRTLCEDKFDEMLQFPGLLVLMARQSHTSITGTTKRTMLTQVIPPELIVRKRESQGEDWIQLWNGSICHFIGLDDPLRWYSSEIGSIAFDECQEIKEETVVRLMTRLRQPGMPCRATFGFNPSSPGHWLQQWFLLGGERTDFGFRKEALYASEADSPLGDAEFVFAKATDNPYLPPGYVEQTLAGMPARLRRRYLEGLWEFTEGNSFFDQETLSHYETLSRDTKPLFNARTVGDVQGDVIARRRKRRPEDPPRIRPGEGPWTIWRKPQPGKRYVMAIDVSSGGSYDYSGIEIFCVEDFEQVAEFQGKLPPAEVALEAYRAGRVFNDALAVPEITGGWGFAVEQELKRFHYPSLYTRKVLDRLTRKWTDRVGWDTNVRTRAHMLDTLERVLREKDLGLYSLRAVAELATFVFGKNNRPEAQEGCNDDLVMSLAMAATVCLELPRQLRRPRRPQHEPQFAATGY